VEKNREIERLRGVAVLLVLTVHIGFFQSILPLFLWSYGRVGVDLFFVISGYVVTLSLIRREFGQIADVGSFYRRRFFRLAPIAIVWMLVHLAVCAIAVAYFPTGHFLPPPDQAWEATLEILRLTYNYHGADGGLQHYWSLIAEWHFYLVLPLILLLFRGRWRLPVIIALVAPFAVYDLSPAADPGTYFMTHPRVPEIGLGVILALWLRPTTSEIKRSPLILRIVVGPALILALWSSPVLFPPEDIFYGGPQIILYGLIGALIVWTATLRRDLIFGIPVVAWVLEWIAGISYPVYVCHFTLWHVTQTVIATYGLTPHPMIELPLQLALTFMVAVLLNRFSSEIERISPKLGRAVVDFLHRSYARLSTTSRIAISARPVGASSEPDRGAAA
jgi:peptidoglycan/LPS O-acetylase OafA/YrhL